MPICLDPKTSTYELWLDSDAEKEPRPTFVFRPESARDGHRWGVLCEMTPEELRREDGAEAAARSLLFRLIEITLVGWRDLTTPSGETVPYDAARLDELLTLGEAKELIEKIRAHNRVTYDEKKASPSPSRGDSGSPAPDASETAAA